MKNVTFNYHLELNMRKIKPEPWAAALPGASPRSEGEMMGWHHQHTLLPESPSAAATACSTRAWPAAEPTWVTWQGLHHWINAPAQVFPLSGWTGSSPCVSKKKGSQNTLLRISVYHNNKEKYRVCQKPLDYAFPFFFSLPHVSSKILQPKRFVLRKDVPIALIFSMRTLLAGSTVTQTVKREE